MNLMLPTGLLFNRDRIETGDGKGSFRGFESLPRSWWLRQQTASCHMSGTTVTHFTLRFAPSIIEEILDDSREELTPPGIEKTATVSTGTWEVEMNIGNSGTLGRWSYSSTHGPLGTSQNHHD